MPEDMWTRLFQGSDFIAIGITGAFAFVLGKMAELMDFPPRRVVLIEMVTAMIVGASLGLLFGLQQGWGVPVEVAKGILMYTTAGVFASQLVSASPLGKVFGRAITITPPPTALPPLAPVDHLADETKPPPTP